MDATLDEDALTGVTLDRRYLVGAPLARGGTSTVYVGTDLRLDRTVAIKVMAPGLAADPVFVDRFGREARAAARLSHINVVAVSDQGTDAGHAFLVMELVRGRTLRDLLHERGRLTPAEAVGVLEAILAGLAAAHRVGLVHRDIKPENVLISDDGVVKVADFGLARAVAAGHAATRTGDVLIGTVAYLSPEQIESGTATPRSDVYAAGIVLYELLTGSPPYDGETAISIAYRHVHHDVPPPSAVAPDVPDRLDELTVDATRREPTARPVDAGAFLAELWDVRSDLGLPRVPVPGRSGSGPGRSGSGPGRPTTQFSGAGAGSGSGGPPSYRTRSAPVPSRTYPVPPAPRPVRPRRRGLLALVVVVLLGLGVGAGGWWLAAGRWTAVPGLVTLSTAEATKAAQDAGVDLRFASSVFSEEVPTGEVIAIDPPAGTRLVRGSEVDVTRSAGPERFTLDPALVGQPLDTVRTALASLPLVVTETAAYDASVPAGSVVGFDPPAGEAMRRDAAVTVQVSRGPAPVDVPDVAGDPQPDAVAALTAAGLRSTVELAFSSTVDKGRVIDQDPAPDGGQVAPGTTVALRVSKGPDLVTVPDVVGEDVDVAESMLRAAGFEVDSTCFLCIGGGTVTLQDPAGGDSAVRGSTVSILATF